VLPGREIVAYDCEGITVGCAICYDLRFPELFQALAMRGAKVIMLPAAFTQQTGKDHWEVLIRARAIETETYMCAAAQTGAYKVEDGSTRLTYGHSLHLGPRRHGLHRKMPQADPGARAQGARHAGDAGGGRGGVKVSLPVSRIRSSPYFAACSERTSDSIRTLVNS